MKVANTLQSYNKNIMFSNVIKMLKNANMKNAYISPFILLNVKVKVKTFLERHQN